VNAPQSYVTRTLPVSFLLPRPCLGLIQFPGQWFPELKWPMRETDYLSAPSGDFKNEGSYACLYSGAFRTCTPATVAYLVIEVWRQKLLWTQQSLVYDVKSFCKCSKAQCMTWRASVNTENFSIWREELFKRNEAQYVTWRASVNTAKLIIWREELLWTQQSSVCDVKSFCEHSKNQYMTWSFCKHRKS
jgi:hypothetical protein